MACLAGYLLLFVPQQQRAVAQATQAKQTQDAQISVPLTATYEASLLATPTLPPTATATAVVAPASPTSTPASTNTPDPSTATVAAALTQAAIAQLTIVPTSTALPGTGIADEYGLPGLVVMAMAFMIVILLARRLRSAPAAK
jgi:hypothetical protein